MLDGLSQIDQIVDRLNDIECDACALTDHGTISGCIEFASKMKKAGKKAILGCEFYVTEKVASIRDESNRRPGHQVILAKNKEGWKDLIRLVSLGNHPDNFYYKPRIDLSMLEKYAGKGNLISFSGHLGSTLARMITENEKVIADWKRVGTGYANLMEGIFGKGNFYLEVQLFDSKANVPSKIMGNIVREIARLTGIPAVATPDSHYAFPNQAQDQRILLAAGLQTTLSKAAASGRFSFFKSDQYFIPSESDISSFHTEQEIVATQEIADKCEDYNVLEKPILPPFPVPKGMTDNEYLHQLCKEGWVKLLSDVEKGSDEFKAYGQRIKYEMDILEGANLASYFLIFRDICNYVRENNWILGYARGSAAGCMVSYLLGITSINPIKHDLIFERFYNAGRNTEDHVALPDIDIDVPKHVRNDVIEYIKSKYGHDRVAQIITFQTIKGRGALKRVFGAYDELSFDEQNAITENIEDEHKIAGELEEMEDASIIRWALENKGAKFKEWVELKEDGSLEGPQADKFAQAIRLEGTKVAQGKHPAGIVIAPTAISEICPLVIDKEEKSLCAGFDGPNCEEIGLVKLDILGIAMLDKVMTIQEMIK